MSFRLSVCFLICPARMSIFLVLCLSPCLTVGPSVCLLSSLCQSVVPLSICVCVFVTVFISFCLSLFIYFSACHCSRFRFKFNKTIRVTDHDVDSYFLQDGDEGEVKTDVVNLEAKAPIRAKKRRFSVLGVQFGAAKTDEKEVEQAAVAAAPEEAEAQGLPEQELAIPKARGVGMSS